MIAPDQDAVLVDLRGEMPVAEMPGQMAQRAGLSGPHLVELLLGRDDLDRAAVLQHQHIAIGQAAPASGRSTIIFSPWLVVSILRRRWRSA